MWGLSIHDIARSINKPQAPWFIYNIFSFNIKEDSSINAYYRLLIDPEMCNHNIKRTPIFKKEQRLN